MAELVKRLDALVDDMIDLIEEVDEETEQEVLQARYQYILLKLQQARSIAKQVR